MRFQISRLFYSFLFLAFANTAWADYGDIQRLFRAPPSLYQLEICHSIRCALVTPLELDHADWIPIDALFLQPVLTAAEERVKIAKAIGLLEEIIGRKAGTCNDRAGTIDRPDYAGELDFYDEAINTTTYLRMLQQAGYIEFHAIANMRTRNFFYDGSPHTTAVIHDLDAGLSYAVDSWFYDNGHPATIVPFNVWQGDYFPEGSPVLQLRKNGRYR